MNIMNELKTIVRTSLEMEVKDRYQKFIDRLLSEIDFSTDLANYNSDSFKLQLFRFDANLWDSYETMLFQEIVRELFRHRLINEICCSLRSPMYGPFEDGRIFEKFAINSIKNQPNEIDVISTQFKKTDAILEYNKQKYILEVKLTNEKTKEQVKGYKKATGITKSISINGDEDSNIRFTYLNIFDIACDYAELFIKMLLTDNTVKTFSEGLVNVIMEIAKLESLGGEQ